MPGRYIIETKIKFFRKPTKSPDYYENDGKHPKLAKQKALIYYKMATCFFAFYLLKKAQ